MGTSPSDRMRNFLVLAAVCVGVSFANICTDDTGKWSFEINGGVTDFAYSGEPLNKKFFCFDGCLATQTAVQNYKVLLANSSVPVMKSERDHAVMVKGGKIRDGDDPNADTCIDDNLRAQMGTILATITTPTAKTISSTLNTKLNRKGWAIVVVASDFAMNSIFQDFNFCEYIFMPADIMYVIKLAKLDMS